MNNKNVDPNKEFIKNLENALNTYSKALFSQRIKEGIKKRRIKNNV